MQLGWFQKRRLLRDGYLLARGLVSRERIDAAVRAINRSLGDKGLPPERLREMRAQTFCPELVDAPEIRALYAETPARALAEAAIGRVRVPKTGQIALRFPDGAPAGAVYPHVDGMYSPENGVPAGTIYHFTALLGVFLSDVTTIDAGNFTVWPGSHTLLEAHFRQHGPETLLQGFPKVALPAPRPLLARAGDVVLAHYALAHGVSPNHSPFVRQAVFFRLFHEAHEQAGLRPLTDLWMEWEGMRDVVPADAATSRERSSRTLGARPGWSSA